MANKIINAAEGTIRTTAFHKLTNRLEMWEYINGEILTRLVDQELLFMMIRGKAITEKHVLEDMFDGSEEEYVAKALAADIFFDYSFLINPSSKAFEGFLFFLAEKFKLPNIEDPNAHIGKYFSWHKIDKEKQAIIDELERNFQGDKRARRHWEHLSSAYESFRNDPMHFKGDVIRTVEKAETVYHSMLNAIDGIIKYIVEKEIIKLSKFGASAEAINIIDRATLDYEKAIS